MSTPLRVGAYLVALVGVFAIALGIGTVLGPFGDPAGDTQAHGHDAASGTDRASGGPDDGHADHATGSEPPAAATAAVGGLSSSQGDHRLELLDARPAAGTGTLRFRIVDAAGEPVTSYDVVHEKRLHLIVVRRDLTGFQHLHPELDPATGVWSTPVELGPGAWRVFADVRPTGAEPLVLGADLLVAGRSRPAAPAEESLADEVDGYAVTLDGQLVPGREVTVTATVSHDGEPVRDLEPYLGAHGHLVVLRDGDLGYLHAHPQEDGSAGPAITFHTTFPSAGRYRAFLDFAHDGRVRTAAFTVVLGPDGVPAAEHDADHGAGQGADDHGDHDH